MIGKLFAASAGVQILGNYMANNAEARAEKINAAYLRQQRLLALRETRRSVDIFKTQSTKFIGDKESALAKSGISLSGTALMTLAQDKASIAREANAIETMGKTKANLLAMKADAADKRASQLKSFKYNFMQALGTGLSSYASYKMVTANNNDNQVLGVTPDGAYSGGTGTFFGGGD